MVGRDEILIAVKHRLAEIGVHPVAAVHEEILQGVALAGVFGIGHKAGNLHKRRFRCHRYQLLLERFAEKTYYALFQSAGEELMESDLIVHEREGLVGIHQREPFELVEDVCEFYRVLFQEFTSGRKVEEQILYRQIRSGGAGFGGLMLEFGCGNLQMSADGIALAHCA